MSGQDEDPQHTVCGVFGVTSLSCFGTQAWEEPVVLQSQRSSVLNDWAGSMDSLVLTMTARKSNDRLRQRPSQPFHILLEAVLLDHPQTVPAH